MCGTSLVKTLRIIDIFSRFVAQPMVAQAPKEVLSALKNFLEDVTRFHDDCSVGAVNPSASQYDPATSKQDIVLGGYSVRCAVPPPARNPTLSGRADG